MMPTNVFGETVFHPDQLVRHTTTCGLGRVVSSPVYGHLTLQPLYLVQTDHGRFQWWGSDLAAVDLMTAVGRTLATIDALTGERP